MAGGITDVATERYMRNLIPPRDEILQEIEVLAEKQGIPIVGPEVGQLLYQLTHMVGAKSVFEMGSAVGYSTIWLARALSEGGQVIYTDSDGKNAAIAREYFRRVGIEERVKIIVGNALTALESQAGSFDVIFNDVHKRDYPRVLELAVPRLRRGGLFISDNTLWSGSAAIYAEDRHAMVERPLETKAIVEFNAKLAKRADFVTTILPVRDGVSVALKL